MTVDLSKIVASSHFSGFQNYETPAIATATIPAQTLAAGGYAVVSKSISLNNVDAVSSVKIQFETVESDWRQMQGRANVLESGGTYQLQAITYYSSGNLVIDIYISDSTGSPNNIPEQTINIEARLFRSPFAL